jgi:hypothetical protein
LFLLKLNSTAPANFKYDATSGINLPESTLHKYLMLAGDDVSGTRSAFAEGSFSVTITTGTLKLELTVYVGNDSNVESYTLRVK